MILSNLVLELEDILDEEEVNQTIDFSVKEVMEIFLQKDSGLILENVHLDLEMDLDYQSILYQMK
mgnify:CR=1 FL=1